MLHLRQVGKTKPTRHTGYREVFLQVSHTIFGKIHSSKALKLPLETSSDRKWHRMTPSLVLGQYAMRAGITKRVYPHLFLHQLMTYLTKQGIISPKLQLLSGHAVEQSLAVYRALALSDVVDEYEAAMQHFPVR